MFFSSWWRLSSSIFSSILYNTRIYLIGHDSSVGIATGYGLDGPEIESRWGEIFRTCPDRPWGPPSLLYNGYRVFTEGKERSGRDADPSPPPSSAVGHVRVELYLYSPYGPYGLYRASVPVQGWPLPLQYIYVFTGIRYRFLPSIALIHFTTS
jgi:hypothetical protein